MASRKKVDTRRRLVDRLFRAFARQLEDVEGRYDEENSSGPSDDGRALTGMVKTLDALMALERRVRSDDETAASFDPEALRADLMERLNKLRERAAGPDVAPEAA